MPCDSRYNITVTWGVGTDADLLMKAMEAEGLIVAREGDYIYASGKGHSIEFIISGGTLQVRSSEKAFDEKALKRAYSVEVVKQVSSRMGYKLREKERGKQYVAIKGY